MKKINFLIIGAQKAGTTALDAYLRQHPDITLSIKKEVHFFDNESLFRNIIQYEEYHKHFPKNITTKMIGETTPIYMYWNQSIKRIYDYNTKIKLIILLRNPIDRAYSHWNMEYSKGKEELNFFEAIQNEKERLKSIFPNQHRVYSYIDRGYYTNQMKNIYNYFPKNQILILKQDDLLDNYQKTLNKVTSFLTVEKFNFQELQNVHKGQYINKMDDKSYKYLQNIFKEEIQNLEKMLSWDCSSWY